MTNTDKHPIAVLISGNGSNLQALIDACRDEGYPAEIKLVISNNSDAYGLERANRAGINTVVLRHQDFADRAAFDQAMHQQLVSHGIELVCLAGFMRLLSAEFVRQWEGRMLNIHPSLLPKFKGLNAIEQAFAAGEKTTGCSVHWVTEGMDEGPIILQKQVKIRPEDTLETLSARLHVAEHACYVEALRQVLEKSTVIPHLLRNKDENP